MDSDLVQIPRADVVQSIGFALWKDAGKRVPIAECYRQAEAVAKHMDLAHWSVWRVPPDYRSRLPAGGVPAVHGREPGG
ncbi:MAG TPA: hypothetical protein EYP07_05705 [Kiloniellaceae bacterium]|nr:hypothetical protein [Kiloniellaceae bacterium]